jgi:hypothetical protein
MLNPVVPAYLPVRFDANDQTPLNVVRFICPGEAKRMKLSTRDGIAVVVALALGLVMPVYSQSQEGGGGSADAAPASEAAPNYSPEALETLLAPIALYPDPVLAQVLASSTNPQEVLDAGNWLIANSELTGSKLSDAATAAGFTPPMMAVMQFPTVVDMMCMKMDWTTELGSAFQADEPGVLDAVQRLRKQAAEMGNLESSEQMKVTTGSQNNQQVITVQPADPQVVYVPQYDPTVVYTTPPPATTTTTVVEDDDDDDDGYSGGEMITAGLLSFGAGMLVNEVFDDDDDDYYSPNWGYGGGSYYPPPYYPRYGNGYRPADSYRRPANYQHGFNNNNIYVNNGGNDYFNRFEGGRNNYRNNPNSPISAARPNRPELGELNRNSQARRTAATNQAGIRKPQGTYTGREQSAAKRPAATSKIPKGTYAGAANPAARQKINPQAAGARDRGHTAARATKPAARTTKPAARPQQASRPAAAQSRATSSHSNALRGSNNSGRQERAASQRGRASMANSPRPSAQRSSGQRGGRR